MIVTGRKGGTYGIRIKKVDRDRYFLHEWNFVFIHVDEEKPIRINISDSFWEKCSELRSARIGTWMENKNLIPWERNKPPKLLLEPISNNRFSLNIPLEK